MKLYNCLCILTNVSIRRCRPRAWVPARWVTLDWPGLKVQPACLVVPLGLVEVGEVDLCPSQSLPSTPRTPTTQVTCSRWGLLAWMIHQTPLEHVTPLQHCNIDWGDTDQLCCDTLKFEKLPAMHQSSAPVADLSWFKCLEFGFWMRQTWMRSNRAVQTSSQIIPEFWAVSSELRESNGM